MLPIRDDNPTARPAVLVGLLIAANVLVFLFVQPTFEDQDTQTIYFLCNAAIPFEVMHGELLAEGVQVSPPLDEREIFAIVEGRTCPDKSVWFSILRSMFFHGNIPHILFNMLFLFVFGNNIEDRLGRMRFVLLYLAAGIVATYAQSVTTPDSGTPVVGASGAIAGVLGAYLLLFPRARVTNLLFLGFFITWIELPAIVVLGIWFLLQLVQQFGSVTGDAGGVAYMAHIGGFVAGMVLLLVLRPQRPRPRAPGW